MRRLLAAAGMLLRRRRCGCSAPLLLLLGAAACLYQTLGGHRNRRPDRHTDIITDEHNRRLVTYLESLHARVSGRWTRRRRAVVLTGGLKVSDTEVQLYRRVLELMEFEVQMSRYAETSSVLRPRPGEGGWSLLLCVGGAEAGCLRRLSFAALLPRQRVNLMPGLLAGLSDSTLCHVTGRHFPFRPLSCSTTDQRPLHPVSVSPDEAPPPPLVATVNVYVLVTSVRPLTAFLHDIVVLSTNQTAGGRAAPLSSFLLQRYGPPLSHDALLQVKRVVGQVLQAAANHKAATLNRCILCYQLLTFTLMFSSSISPVVSQVDADLTLGALSEDGFDRQVTKDLILEDVLHFLLDGERDGHPNSTAHPLPAAGEQDGGCSALSGACLPEDDLLLLLQFQRQMAAPQPFHLVFPSVSSSSLPSSSAVPSLTDLLLAVARHYASRGSRGVLLRASVGRDAVEGVADEGRGVRRGNAVPPQPIGRSGPGRCPDPRLRQIYLDPPLGLTPPFSPQVKEYHADVAFDTLVLRIRPVALGAACGVHLDNRHGPRMASVPVGLGDSRIAVLVTGGGEGAPVVMATYTLHLHRESRPSLPAFGDRVTCSFVQDCGLLVLPGRACGLEPHVRPPGPPKTCSSGYGPGRWVVPCLSCHDNRTCDWREVAWQPDGCSHRVVRRPLLQTCMTDRKVLFLGDSTNRGMMFFLMERLNASLAAWGKAHDTLVYGNLNGGRSFVSYSYYPRFWLDEKKRPSFGAALQQLLLRSRPLANSERTVLVVGGVQWLTANHLETVREVLRRESLEKVLVVVKTLGMGFHLPVDGIRSRHLPEIQQLHRENGDIISASGRHGFEVVDTFAITMGRYKEFLQGRCACHFHEVEKLPNAVSTASEQGAGPRAPAYHVRGPVNQAYSEILLSRLCPPNP